MKKIRLDHRTRKCCITSEVEKSNSEKKQSVARIVEREKKKIIAGISAAAAAAATERKSSAAVCSFLCARSKIVYSAVAEQTHSVLMGTVRVKN